MRKYLTRFYIQLVVLFFLLSCTSIKDKKTEFNQVENGQKLHRVFKKKNGDQSAEFTKMILEHPNQTIELEPNKKYIIADLLLDKVGQLKIIGNGSTFCSQKNDTVNSILKFIDPIQLEIENLTIDGNFPNSYTTDYLLKVHTPSDITKIVYLRDLHLKDGDNGGFMIHNVGGNKNVRN